VKLNIAIVEDSQENIEVLQYLLDKASIEVDIKGIAKTLGEAELLLSRPDIDLAFLDIQLREGTIFDVLQKLHSGDGVNFDMVFVTAHGSYENAMKAIQFACLDFINKPIDAKDLDTALQKGIEKRKDVKNDDQIKYLLELIGEKNHEPHSMGIILSKGRIEFVQLKDIVHFEADQSICRIFFHDEQKMISAKHLGYYIELLSDNADFIQTSKSHLINISQIKQYDHRERTIRFHNGTHVIASHRFSKDIRKALLDRQSNKNFISRFFGNK
jgi:two-component system LytT family response regulator